MVDVNISKYPPNQKDSPKTEYPTTLLSNNKKAPPLGSEYSTKNGGIWNIKHDIISRKFYELLINTELKGNTEMDLKNFYNHIKMYLNAVAILR